MFKIFQQKDGSRVSLEDSPQDESDSDESRASKGTFQVDPEEEKVAVAHHDF